ncbi:MAG TPA: patatin-like phospholipase family protein [Acholeplasmataceae bacterium]|nr:patatin-like phospholipase family protein [Acholeplasmataceae bacterium]
MKVDLVFEGGGILGIAFVGAYHALTMKGYEIDRCAGTSAGAIISSLIIAGYTSSELKVLIKETDFSQFLKKTSLSKISLIGKALSFVYNKGIYDIRAVEKWIEFLLLKKQIKTFKDIKNNVLKVIAADITNRKLLILPDDLKFYGINSDNFSIAKAVAMSCSIPLFFTPIIINNSFIVDGGLLSSFPIWIFDVEGMPRYPTFGIKIKDPVSLSFQGKTGIISYIKDLLYATYNKEETTFLRDEDLVRTIIIDFDNKTKATDLTISSKRIDYLYTCGYKSTIDFLSKWSFRNYIKKYRS